MADFKGRKPVMIITTSSAAVFTLMFGFSVNYPMAIVARILTGFTNGEQDAETYVSFTMFLYIKRNDLHL